ncbi:MAG: hypothetical protein IJK93_09205 [Muribaculaceae bacterium]|nr:hypothetical protein [Muribaculaceae bacterium]
MKKILFTFLTVLLATLAAQAATDYGFSVAGTTVTSDNCNNITSSYITSGTVYYTPSNNTLVLNNVTINMTGSYNRCINNLENSDLTIMFRGTCNLKAQDAAAIRIRKTTNLWAPQATDVVNITGYNDNAIYMATTNDYELWIMGPGTFNISTWWGSAIEDEDNTTSTQLDVWHEVYFDNVNAVVSTTGLTGSPAKRVLLRFKPGSSVRFKATTNQVYPVINYCGWQVYGNETLLEPTGAYFSGSYVYDSSGNKVYNQDVYVSDDYVAIINATNFPNANFRSYLLDLYPKGYITQTDVNNCTYMDISGKSISSISGIQYFTELKTLYANDNLLNMVDLTSNTKLEYLYMQDNRLAELKLTGLTQLKTLNVSRNWITNTNSATGGCLPGLSTCYSLQTLYCNENSNLTSFNVSTMSALKTIDCRNNPSLATMDCYHNALTTLYVNGNTALTKLRCYENPNLTKITGLGECTAITYLDCEDCAITDLTSVNNMTNIATLLARNNQLTTLAVTGKTNLTNLRVNGNTTLTNLTCYRNALTTLNVTGCTALKEFRCYENANLATITGLADCTAITYLDCEDCAITNLSAVNSMTNIEKLYARNNKLTDVNITNKNNLTYVRVSGNTLMTYCQVYNCTNLASLILTGCTSLETLQCAIGQLTSLDVTGCTAIKHIQCNRNKINGTGMNTLVNSLPTRSASDKGKLYAVTNTNEGNSMTAAQITTARNKNWIPYRYNGSTWVEMTVSTRGDVNGDGSVNIADVTALIDLLLTGNASSNSAADCNQDGNVNIADVTKLIDYLLSGSW